MSVAEWDRRADEAEYRRLAALAAFPATFVEVSALLRRFRGEGAHPYEEKWLLLRVDLRTVTYTRCFGGPGGPPLPPELRKLP